MKSSPDISRLLTAVLAWTAISAQSQVAKDEPWPGTLQLQVDATDLAHRVFQVREKIPVRPGPLTLYYPRWLPGEHGPTGRVDDLAGLRISAAGKPVAWRRDPRDVFAFEVEVPPGADALDIEFQNLAPVESGNSRVVMTAEMLRVKWNSVLLYPAGHWDRDIMIQPTLRLPAGWAFASALEAASSDGPTTSFKPVSVETLIDSPLYAGRYMTRVDLDPEAAAQGRGAVFLDMISDTASELVATPDQLAAHRALVTQADRLFGARHFAHYDFLFSISDQIGWDGLEHHQSSEDSTSAGYFTEWSQASQGRDLLAHEYTHSWNGKFRRPADLWTPNPNEPMQDSLLWVYEGQTQFWGEVLAVRSGLVPLADELDELALTAQWAATRAGRAWRNLQDTTNQPIIDPTRRAGDWRSWQRGEDYYPEMVLVWLEADMLIREGSGGARSLDDFARAFFGVEAGRVAPLTYTFDDVVAALDQVQHLDWAAFLRRRLDSHETGDLLKGLERAGWRLAWTETPTGAVKAAQTKRKMDDFSYSLGMAIGHDGKITAVRWGSPAFEAGLSPTLTVIAVDGLAYKGARLASAVSAAKGAKSPIQLLVKDGEHFRTVAVVYAGGLRYPKLERIEGKEDLLGRLLAAKP